VFPKDALFSKQVRFLRGSLRATAQMISYEVSIGLIVMPIILIVGSTNLDSRFMSTEITEVFDRLASVAHGRARGRIAKTVALLKLI
jgi:hypothetical protein